MKALETTLETWIFRCRWLLAPFFIGLLLAIVVLLLKFAKELMLLFALVFSGDGSNLIVAILSLVDTALIASLLLIISFSGYENFVSKMSVGDHEDRPAWMGKVSFSDLKIKLIGAIVAISAVELLKGFINSAQLSNEELAWKVAIHLTFVVSGVLFAVSDRISETKSRARGAARGRRVHGVSREHVATLELARAGEAARAPQGPVSRRPPVVPDPRLAAPARGRSRERRLLVPARRAGPLAPDPGAGARAVARDGRRIDPQMIATARRCETRARGAVRTIACAMIRAFETRPARARMPRLTTDRMAA